MEKKKVAVVGATGVAGQQFLVALSNHPWFEVTGVAASARSAGRPLRDALRDPGGAMRWYCREAPPEELLDLFVHDATELDAGAYDIVFTAIDSDAARELEPRYARTTPVFSTASAFRYEADTPIAVPGVNVSAHASLLAYQRRSRGWKGFILPQSNCTVIGIVLPLAALGVGVRRVAVTTLQSLSGAGRSPGVAGLDILDNLIPYIPKEEEKVALETAKILGKVEADHIRPHPCLVSATCTRVPVMEGHTAAISVEIERPMSVDEAAERLRAWPGEYVGMDLPSAPPHPIVVVDDPYRPQPRLDRDRDAGMVVTVGRIRPEPLFEAGLKLVSVSHNTRLGAARGQVLAAEQLLRTGAMEE